MEPKTEKQNLLREGKAKKLYSTNHLKEPAIIQFFKDDATAFNAQKKGTIHGKGVVNNAISTWIFKYLEKNGIATHFIEKLSDREMLVKQLEIIPIEMVARNRAAGSICKRLGIEKGTVFSSPLIEFFYKSDELGDPLIGETHILFFKWASKEELERLVSLTLQVNQILRKVFLEAGLELIDFKLEFGRGPKGQIFLADEFTPDGCRLWDEKTQNPMDKDRFRQDLGGVENAYQEVYRRLELFFKGKL